jgi:hypothetical protein
MDVPTPPVQQEADMIKRILANAFSSSADWSLVPIIWATQIPPRDPNDDDAEDEEEEDDGDAESDDEPAVIREPDE